MTFIEFDIELILFLILCAMMLQSMKRYAWSWKDIKRMFGYRKKRK